MRKVLFLSAFMVLSLVGCGEGDAFNSQLQSEEEGPSRSRYSAEPAFVEAQDGTMYLISCLKKRGADIAAGVRNAGQECAANNLPKETGRGLMTWYGDSSLFFYLQPQKYFGGNNTKNFCQQTFGVSWGGCFSWLGYGQQQYQTQYYQPTCGSCTRQVQTGTSTWTINRCPTYCQNTGRWSQYAWAQGW